MKLTTDPNKKPDLVARQVLKKANKLTLRQMQMQKLPNVDNVTILGDVSGSMNGEKMDALKKALTEVWRPGLDAMVFGSEVYQIQKTDIQSLYTMGSTCMLAALQEAWQSNTTHIILISDGDPTDASTGAILEEAIKHKEIPIDTIGIGSRGMCDYDPVFLARLAEITGGHFSDCGMPIMLSQIIKDLLEWKPTELVGDKKSEVIEL